jgi:hypothetical protein
VTSLETSSWFKLALAFEDLRESPGREGVAIGVSNSEDSCQPVFSAGYSSGPNAKPVVPAGGVDRNTSGDGCGSSRSDAAVTPMYFVSRWLFSILSGRPTEPESLCSHHLLAVRPRELSSSGTVLTAMLGIGDSEGLNCSPHCLESARSSMSALSSIEAVSVAGVNSPIDEAELGMAPCAEASPPSDAQEGMVGSIDDIEVLGVMARLLSLVYERHMSLVKSITSPAILLYADWYRSRRSLDSCTRKLAKISSRSSSDAAVDSFSIKARWRSVACW